jgi:hypothetical protein
MKKDIEVNEFYQTENPYGFLKDPAVEGQQYTGKVFSRTVGENSNTYNLVRTCEPFVGQPAPVAAKAKKTRKKTAPIVAVLEFGASAEMPFAAAKAGCENLLIAFQKAYVENEGKRCKFEYLFAQDGDTYRLQVRFTGKENAYDASCFTQFFNGAVTRYAELATAVPIQNNYIN